MLKNLTKLKWVRVWGYLFVAALLLMDVPSADAELRLHGSAHVSLKAIAAKWGMRYSWIEPGEKALLKSQWTRLQFELHHRYCKVNGSRVYLGKPVTAHQQRFYISKHDYESTLKPILMPQVFPEPPKLYRIVIDPGHGGKDPGAENAKIGVNEKATVLSVAKKLQAKLEAYGYKVTLTRTSDTFVTLKERARFANQHKADLFISLHFNAVKSSRVKGVETFVFTLPGHPSSHRSKVLASDKKVYAGNAKNTWSTLAGYYIQRSMAKNLDATDRGLKRARFTVLRDLKCPGLLVEGGFVSNMREGKLIKSKAYQERLADSILQGVLTYQKTLNRIRQRKVAQAE